MTIKIDNFSIGNAAGGGGTVTGSGVPGQIAFWDSVSSITGDLDLIYDSTLNILTSKNYKSDDSTAFGNSALFGTHSINGEFDSLPINEFHTIATDFSSATTVYSNVNNIFGLSPSGSVNGFIAACLDYLYMAPGDTSDYPALFNRALFSNYSTTGTVSFGLGNNSKLSVDASTVIAYANFQADEPSVNNGGSVTDIWGFKCLEQKKPGVTNGWAFWQDGVNDLNYYAGRSEFYGQAYFANKVGISQSTPRVNLELGEQVASSPIIYLSAAGITTVFTNYVPSDVFSQITSNSTTLGGLWIDGFAGEDIPGITLNCYNGTDGASSNGALLVNLYKSDAGGDVATFGSNEKAAIFKNGNSQEIFNVLGGGAQIKGRLRTSKHSIPVASASSLDLGGGGNFTEISGNTTIDYISVTDWDSGSIAVLQFTGSPIVKYNTGGVPFGYASILLSGAVDFNATANDTLVLIYNGTNWVELARTTI